MYLPCVTTVASPCRLRHHLSSPAWLAPPHLLSSCLTFATCSSASPCHRLSSFDSATSPAASRHIPVYVSPSQCYAPIPSPALPVALLYINALLSATLPPPPLLQPIKLLPFHPVSLSFMNQSHVLPPVSLALRHPIPLSSFYPVPSPFLIFSHTFFSQFSFTLFPRIPFLHHPHLP